MRARAAACAAVAWLVGGAVPAAPGHGHSRERSASPVRQEKPAAARKPKSQRWQVSWAVDSGARRIRSRPRPASIARLLQFKRPKDLPGTGVIPDRYRTQRVNGVETVVWSVTGTVVNVAAERDGDYRLILSDGRGASLTCVLPDPARAPQRGRFSARIDFARAAVVRKFHPTLEPREVRAAVRVAGIGYFGRFNSDANKSPEGFQLHPVIEVRFGSLPRPPAGGN